MNNLSDLLVVFTNRFLHLRFPAQPLKKQLVGHPSYPSLLSIVDTLKARGLHTEAIQIDKEDLPQLTPPYLVHLPQEDLPLMILTKVYPDAVEWTNGFQAYREPTTNFLSKWSGIIIYTEGLTSVTKKNNIRQFLNRIKKGLHLKNLAFVAAILGLISISIFKPAPWTSLGLDFLFSLGLYLSWLLFLQGESERDEEGKCRDTVRVSCNSILHSKGASFLGIVKWSEVGIIYFMTGLCSLLASNSLSTLALFAAVGMPYSIYSVAYQWWVMRSWCLLCLLVQGVLVAAFLLLLPFFALDKVSLASLTLSLAFISFSAVLVFVLKPLVKEAYQYRSSSKFIEFLKKQPDVLLRSLETQPYYSSSGLPEGLVLGDPKSTGKIVIILNPYCFYCARLYQQFLAVRLMLQERFTINVVFNVPDRKDAPHRDVANHVLSISAAEGTETAARVLEQWFAFSAKEKEDWLSRKEPVERFNAVLAQQRVWHTEAGIKQTPAVLVNNRLLPHFILFRDLAKI